MIIKRDTQDPSDENFASLEAAVDELAKQTAALLADSPKAKKPKTASKPASKPKPKVTAKTEPSSTPKVKLPVVTKSKPSRGVSLDVIRSTENNKATSTKSSNSSEADTKQTADATRSKEKLTTATEDTTQSEVEDDQRGAPGLLVEKSIIVPRRGNLRLQKDVDKTAIASAAATTIEPSRRQLVFTDDNSNDSSDGDIEVGNESAEAPAKSTKAESPDSSGVFDSLEAQVSSTQVVSPSSDQDARESKEIISPTTAEDRELELHDWSTLGQKSRLPFVILILILVAVMAAAAYFMFGTDLQFDILDK